MKKKIVLYPRRTERILLLGATLLLGIMAFQYYQNRKADFINTDYGYESGKVINLAAPVQAATLQQLFAKGGYFTDEAYIRFIAGKIKTLVEKERVLPNLGALNKNSLMIPATDFLNTSSPSGKLRFLNAITQLDMDSALYDQELKNPVAYPDEVAVQNTKTRLSIHGKVRLGVSDSSEGGAAKGVLVKLTEIFPSNYYDTLSTKAADAPAEFLARTNENGAYEFYNLKEHSNYRVTAMKPGYDFGGAKGIAAMDNDQTFNFSGKPHLIRLLDRTEFRQIKNDKIFTVRTPADFKKEYITNLVLFVLAFWAFHFILWLKNYRSDQFILPLLFFLSGTGIMALYSMQDPLRDIIHGSGMAKCAAGVLLFAAVVLFFLKDRAVMRFYHSRWFDPVYALLPGAGGLKAPRGYSWMLLSIALMLLLAFIGTGPEGSGVKVNLFGFQVSELSKFLMIVFFAAYFAVNSDYFRNIPDNRWLTRNNLKMLLLFVFLLAVYAALGDLGPAIVLCLTFLFFYSFAKEEFFAMVLAAVSYVVLLTITSRFINDARHDFLPGLATLACVGTLAFAFFKKRYESVFFIILIISSFILLATLPFEFTQRLADRNGMFRNIWENKLIGGDQVAHGIWSLNAGGFFGQGLGQGYSSVMPAYHTDMILESIGEELGITALIALFLAFGLLTYRSLLAARRTGKPFLFYLVAGIAIATVLQFFLITAGTLGLIPLTGISVPFLSKGNAGIIITLAAFILVLILSHERGDALEMEYVKKNFDNVNAYAILSFFAVLIFYTGTLFWYQYKSDEYITKPSLVLNRKGAWQYSYNPRIGIFLREIRSGNIYDKNGVLLATSSKATFDQFKNKLIPLGANPVLYAEQLKREQHRYYPFGADLLFWLGDYNKEIANEEEAGYAAEYRHYTLLKGFDVTYTTSQKTSDRYREARFLPVTEKESELVKYDYSALAPILKEGKNGKWVELQNNKDKDIRLSLDVVLNQKINAVIQNTAASGPFRTSVVALNAATGDVLASASNPAPSYKDLKLISNIDPSDYRTIFRQLFQDRVVVPQDLGITFNSRPGSTVKIIDATAAMNQYGTAASQFSYFIYPAEVIHQGEPVNMNVDMRTAIVRSSNVYFIKLANDKNLQTSLFNLYDALGMNILNRGGFHFQRPEDYDSERYFKEWGTFVAKGKSIFNSQRLMNTRRRLQSPYSDLAWGQGELAATPLHLARMSGVIADSGVLQPSRFLFQSWNNKLSLQKEQSITSEPRIAPLIGEFMKEQSAKVSAASGLTVHGKTGSPERDKLIRKADGKTALKRVTDSWYTFFVASPKLRAPVAFTIRIEEIGNSEYAKTLAVELLKQLKSAGYF
ncbi:FtsW/RodA/SpoVE family cell cycle protein [Niabella beijingensis]|uniref:FtsW/RodA/SpoVE family cell cycle protein n=1 Tax=Niabella beijingensis TaxID=2872700 RepID=UPI001CBDF310|nr:FtsW/RodA/SpoVE family cell cycle protein [Niabella beijingensis]MBZ4191123.1 FtsW/RodA/SpoVE family cell cycle protein [Niabella beijingensis]